LAITAVAPRLRRIASVYAAAACLLATVAGAPPAGAAKAPAHPAGAHHRRAAAHGHAGHRRVAASADQLYVTASPSPFLPAGGSTEIVARLTGGQGNALGVGSLRVTLPAGTAGMKVTRPTAAERSRGVVAVVTAGPAAGKATLTVSVPGTAVQQQLPLASYTSPAQLVAGKGAWISFDAYGQMAYPTMLQRMAQEGVTHVYVETTGVNFIGAPYLNGLLEQAHNLGIAVIAFAWAPLSRVQQEIASAGQTIAYATANGAQVDGFAGDFEQNLAPGAMRTFSAAVRQDLGPHRAYVGIIYAPQFGFATPVATMARYVDAFAPMDYWDASAARAYSPAYAAAFVAASIRQLRATPGENNVPIEVVSQTQDIASASGFGPLNPPAAQVAASAQAAAADGAIGVSFYELCNQTPAQIAAITAFQMP